MSYSTVFEAETFLQVESRPQLDSFDSGHECSLAHLLELYRIVEAEERETEGYVFDDSCLRVG